METGEYLLVIQTADGKFSHQLKVGNEPTFDQLKSAFKSNKSVKTILYVNEKFDGYIMQKDQWQELKSYEYEILFSYFSDQELTKLNFIFKKYQLATYIISKEQYIRDHFSIIPVKILSLIVKGEVDCKKIAKWHLDNRGLDNNGEWVGFNKNLNESEHPYHKFFIDTLKEYGVKSPNQLSDENKKEFFNKMKGFKNG